MIKPEYFCIFVLYSFRYLNNILCGNVLYCNCLHFVVSCLFFFIHYLVFLSCLVLPRLG